MTWNIRHGEGLDGRIDLERIAALIAQESPDVVFLQEVDRNTVRSGNVDQAAWIAQRLGMWSSFGAFMPFQGGEYGLAMLTRTQPRDVRNVVLPAGEQEPRTVLLATVGLDGGRSVRLVNVHLDWLDDDQNRFAQAKEMLNVVSRDVAGMAEGAAIVGGDFNDGPGSRTIELVKSQLTEMDKPDGNNTWPSGDPKQEIDFIFVLPGGWLTAQPAVAISAQGASDHHAVVGGATYR